MSDQDDSQTADNQLVVEPDVAYREVFEEEWSIDYELTLRNHGDRPVRILKIQPSCSCTVAKLSSDIVPPRGSVSLHIVYDVPSQYGELANRRIAITTDHPQSPVILCEVGGYRHRRYVLKPVSVNFGQVEVGRPVSAEVTMDAKGDDNELVVGQAISTSPFIFVGLLGIEPIELGRRYRVRINLEKLAPVGDFEAKLFVPHKQDDGVGPQVWIRANILGPVRLVPSAAYFGVLAKDDRPLVVTVGLKGLEDINKKQRLREITNVFFENMPAGITATEADNDPSTIKVTADPGKLPVGILDQSAVVSCDYGGQLYRIELRLRAMITE